MKAEDVKIVFPLDVASEREAMELMEELQDVIDVPKVGLELVHSIGTPMAVEIAGMHGHPVFLDVKLNDIPNTVAGASRAIVRHRVSFFNVMASGGEAMIAAAVEATRDETQEQGVERPMIITVTVLTNLNVQDLKKLGIEPIRRELYHMSEEEKKQFIAGVVMKWSEIAVNAGTDILLCDPSEAAAVHNRWPNTPIFTPNIRLPSSPADDQEKSRTMTPGEAAKCGSVGLVIGRPIRNPVGGKTRQEVVAEIRADIAQTLAV